MLWDRVQQLKELLSLLFCIGFSIVSLVWNSNLVVRTVASSQRVSDVISSSVDSAGGLFKNIYRRIQSNEALRKERDSYAQLVDQYRVYYHDIETLQAENSALRKELGFQLKSNYPVTKAEILSFRLNSIYRTIIISKGKKDKVYPFMPVVANAVNEKGEIVPALVGKVIAANQTTSVIQPLINSNFSMGVQVENGNFWAILSGNSGRGNYAVLNYLDPGVLIDKDVISKIGPGDLPDATELQKFIISGKQVFSSAGGGIFPARLPIGIIVEEGERIGQFKSAYVKPYIKFEDLKYVTVIQKFPDKWVEEWPEEKAINLENPYYGELDFPGEEPDKETKVQSGTKPPAKPVPPVKKTLPPPITVKPVNRPTQSAKVPETVGSPPASGSIPSTPSKTESSEKTELPSKPLETP